MVHGRSIVQSAQQTQKIAVQCPEPETKWTSTAPNATVFGKRKALSGKSRLNSQYMWCLKALDISTLWPNGNTHGSHRRNVTAVW